MTSGGPTVFLGDSLTAGHDWSRDFPEGPPVNLGESGDTCAGLWSRLAEATDLKPARVFLQIGINDLLRGAGSAEIIAGHRRLWDELAAKAPQARLFVVSLAPCLKAPDLPASREIIDINRNLAAEAARRRLIFIDLFPALADEDGRLRPECSGDGLHLTPRGYLAWAAALRPHFTDMAIK